MAIINGKNIFISVRDSSGTYYPIGCDLSCTISMERAVIAVTGPGDGVFRRVIPGGTITGTVSGNGLINFQKNMGLFELGTALIAGTSVLMMCEIVDPVVGGSFVAQMAGYVTSTELTGAYRAAGSFTYEIAVDGPIIWTSDIPKYTDEAGVQNLLAIGDGDLLGLRPAETGNLII